MVDSVEPSSRWEEEEAGAGAEEAGGGEEEAGGGEEEEEGGEVGVMVIWSA